MKIAVIGLGSMGKRRLRNLKALGYSDILGFDLREDRRQEAQSKHGIRVVSDLADLEDVAAVIISTPPDHHQDFIDWCLARKKPCFVELSIVLQDLPRIQRDAKAKGVLVAPSSTFLFHPAIQHLKSIIAAGEHGKVTDFSYHSGNYLPDWHPWEGVKGFFVSNPETSGCRELLAFELNWITHCFGQPEKLHVQGHQALGFGLTSNDTCGVLLRFPTFISTLLVDVVSRFATRSLTVNFEKGQFRWNWESKETRLYSSDRQAWTSHPFELGQSEAGYNENLSETIYVAELRAFLNAVEGNGVFPSNLDVDIYNLQLLKDIDV